MAENRNHQNQRNKRRGEKRCARRTVRTVRLALLLVCLTSLLASSVFVLKTHASQEEPHDTYYTSVLVEDGDTLWEIAERYGAQEPEQRSAFIEKVRDLNHLDEDRIHAGCYLTIPYDVPLGMGGTEDEKQN